jgi:hypothetical protein
MAFPTVPWRHTEVLVADVVALGAGAWGRPSFPALLPLVARLPRINDANHPLGTGMDMNMSDFNGLLVTAPVVVQCPDEIKLQAQQLSGIAPVDADERFVQMPLAVPKELEAGESRCNDLNSN